MSNKTINEGNKLIADFNGYLEKGKAAKDPYFYAMQHAYDNGNLKYHTSWDWLMPVVEKIETLTAEDGRGEVNYIVSIEDKSCIISQGGEGELVFVQSDESKIDSTWQACVDFIKYYNQTPHDAHH